MVILNSATPSTNSLISPDNGCNMLAVLEYWEETEGHHVDNTPQYLLLMLFKLGLEILVVSLCWCRLHTSFLGVCSLSVFTIDSALVGIMAALWWLGPERSPVSVCFVLAHASAVYAALPLPMLLLGLLDYLHEPRYYSCHGAPRRALQNWILALLVWFVAGTCSICSTDALVLETEYATGRRALVCQTQGSTVVSFFCIGLFVAACCVLLPFSSRLPAWLRKVNKLSAKRANSQTTLESDLHFCMKKVSEPVSELEIEMVESGQPIPPLYAGLTLCFCATWMPYLVVSISCQLMDFMVPAYITVNLLWFECAKSLLIGVVFWLKNDYLGPYSDLPDDVCEWGVHWNLSKRTPPYCTSGHTP